jgi:hypothetical protein
VLDSTLEPSACSGVEPPPQPGAAPGPRRTHRSYAPAGGTAAATAAGLALGTPVLVLIGAAAAVGLVLRRWLPWDLALPGSVLGLLVAATGAGLVADAVGLDLLAAPALIGAVAAFAVAAAVLTVRRARTGERWPAAGPWWSYLPAWAAGAVGLAQTARQDLAATWVLGATDPAQHVLFLGEVQRVGALDYAAEGYPRGLHMLLALVSAPGAPPTASAELLSRDLALYATATWLSYAVVLAMGAAVTLRLGRRLGMSQRLAAAAALLLGAALLLTNSVVDAYVYMGAAPALLALCVMWFLPLLVLARGRVPAGMLLVVTAVAVMLLAHLWQALVVVPPVALAAWAASRPPGTPAGGGRRGRPRARHAVLVVGSCALAVAATAPPLLGVLGDGGLSRAATPGTIVAPPWSVLVLALLLAGGLVRRWQDPAVRVLLGSGLGLLVVVGLLLAGSGSMQLGDYYPAKACWFLTVLLAPVVCLGTVAALPHLRALLARATDALGRGARVFRVTGAAAVVILGFAWVAPGVLAEPRMSVRAVAPADDSRFLARQLDVAREHATRHAPAMTVPVGIVTDSPFSTAGTYVVSKLIAFQTGQPVTRGRPGSVCEDVEKASAGSRAVVVTDLDVGLLQRLMAAQGCGEVPVVGLTGSAASPTSVQNQILESMVGR